MGSGQHRRNSCGAAVRSLHPNPTHRRLWGAKPQRERALDCLPKRGGCPVGGGQRSSTLLVVCPGPARTASNGPTSPRSAVPRSPSRNGGPATFFPCKRIPRETRKSSAAILRSAPAASGAAGGAARAGHVERIDTDRRRGVSPHLEAGAAPRDLAGCYVFAKRAKILRPSGDMEGATSSSLRLLPSYSDRLPGTINSPCGRSPTGDT
jgi:hypothetical protein